MQYFILCEMNLLLLLAYLSEGHDSLWYGSASGVRPASGSASVVRPASCSSFKWLLLKNH